MKIFIPGLLPPGFGLHLQFDHEHDVVLDAKGDEADLWNARIKQYGAFLVLLWIALTRFHKAVPSHNGLMVWGKEGMFRLGSLAVLYKPEWRSVVVIHLLTSRQKAWLHGCSFNTAMSVTPDNQDERGRAVE